MSAPKRRQDGDGSVYRTADGRYRGSVVTGFNADGKPIKRYVSAPTEKQAAARVRDLIRDRDAGRLTADKPPTLAGWLDHWLEHIARPKVRPNTYNGYAVAVARITGHFGPKARLDRVTAEDLDKFFAAMRAERSDRIPAGHSETNVRLHFAVLRAACNVAVRRGHLATSPCEGYEMAPPTKYHANPLTVAESKAVLAEAAKRRAPVRWLFALLLGWRQGEVLGLTWDMIDLGAGTVKRQQSLQRVRGAGLQIVRPKSRSAERPVPLPPIIVAGLRAWRQAQRLERVQRGPTYIQKDLLVNGKIRKAVPLVFTRPGGQPISREDDWEQWHKILTAAKVAPRRPHDAKHTAGTLMAAVGIHPRVAQELLGHSDIATTMRIYTDVPTDVARDAVETLGRLLSPDGPPADAGTA